jgi:hypothetical protein
MEVHQWAVIYHNGNNQETEIFDRFRDAFAYSQPDADDEIDWRYTRGDEIEARFNQGENEIRVAWSDIQPNAFYVIIRRH